MDLPIINKYDNMRASMVWVKIYLNARLGRPIDCGRVKARFHRIAKYNPADKDITAKTAPGFENASDDVKSFADKNFSKEEILNTLEECDISGCGGAGYPTYKKLAALKPGKDGKKTLVINAVECDIGLVHDEYIFENYFDEVETAAKILKDTFGFDTVIMGLKHKTSVSSDVMTFKKVSDGYPAGAERILINLLTGDVILGTEKPTERGYVVLNIQTMLTVYNALRYGKKYDGKFITVTNVPKRHGIAVYVPFGTPVSEIAQQYLGDLEDGLCLLVGSGVMKGHIAEDGEVTGKETNFIAYGERPLIKETTDCMYCNACIRACPMEIKVKTLVDNIINGYFKEAAVYGPERCIGCNSCSYVCFYRRNNPQVILEYNQRRLLAEAAEKAE